MSVVFHRIGALGVLAAALGWGLAARSQEPPPPAADPLSAPAADAGVNVQARGPVHEAYAQPLDQKPGPGPIVPKKPPDPITEVPPDQKPEGDNVQWIPGYWAWDDGRNDFLWVSGFWRVVPPGRKWVPGHWQQAEGGWQWVAGFWAPASQGETQYLPPPPDSLDYGPTTPPPDDNSIWVPGCWRYLQDDYAWRPGYWTGAQPGYVWMPDHYCWTPAGCVFVSGYWDYPLADRGLLCAPAYFSQPLWQTPGWCYHPSYCVDLASLLASLWVRPGWCHYYFGDYYGDRWRGRGYYPWLGWSARHYDPLFAYDRWYHRDDPGWYRGLRGEYLARQRGDLPRLPHTLAEQHAFLRDGRLESGLVPRVVTPVSRFHSQGFRLATVGREQLLAHQQAADNFRALGRERQALEGRGPRPDFRAAPFHSPAAAPRYEAARPQAFAPPYHPHAAPSPPREFASPPHFAAPAFHSQGHPLPGNFHGGRAPSFAGHGGGHAPAGGGHAHGGGGHGHGGHH